MRGTAFTCYIRGVRGGLVLALGLAASPPTDGAEQPTVRVAIELDAHSDARARLVLGAHLRMGGFDPVFVDETETADLRVGRVDGTCRVQRVDGGEPRGFWSQPCADEPSAVELETLAHAARSLAATPSLPEPEPEPEPEPDMATRETETGAPTVEPGPEPELDVATESDMALASPLAHADIDPERDRLFVAAPRRRVFTADVGWAGWAAGPRQWQNGATFRVGWTTAGGLDVGLGGAVTQEQSATSVTQQGELLTRSKRWPIFADAGYRLELGRRVDIGLGGRGGVDLYEVETEPSSSGSGRDSIIVRPGTARTVTGFLGPAVSVGVWTSGPIALRARAGLELPLGRQPVADTEVRIVTGVDVQFGVGPGNLREPEPGETRLGRARTGKSRVGNSRVGREKVAILPPR